MAKLTVNKVKKALKELSDDSLLAIWNAYAIERDDAVIYDNDPMSYAECFQDDVEECVRAIMYGEMKTSDNFFYLDAYQNIATFNDIHGENSPFDFDSLADFLATTHEGNDIFNDYI